MKRTTFLLFFWLLLLGSTANAQKVALSLQFNLQQSTYDVFVKPDFSKEGFLIGAGSQITVLIPSDFADEPIVTQANTAGKWLDQAPLYAPKNYEAYDFHTFISQGEAIDFQSGAAVKLFSFKLPLNYDHKKIRLFIKGIDPRLPTSGGINTLGNFIANDITLTDFYQKNYGILKDLQGTVKDWRGYPMENVHVKVGNTTFTSLYDGRFEFRDIAVSDFPIFQLEQNIDAKAGVNTADAIRLQQHLSGEKLFDQPFQWIAADLDNSGTITYQDLALLKQLINDENKDAGWRFLPSRWLHQTKDYQKSIPKQLSIQVPDRIIAVDFAAVKLGDVNGSYTLKDNIPNNILPSPRTLTINLLNETLKAGQQYLVAFSTNDFLELTAYQATLKIEHAKIVKLDNTFKKQPGLSLRQLPNDIITVNWLHDGRGRSVVVNQSNKQHQPETAILELEIIPNREGLVSDFITLLNQPTRTEAYDKDGKAMALQLLFRKAPETEETFVLYQNRPNPFRESTQISYFLPQQGMVTLTLTNEEGQQIRQEKVVGNQGFNVFTLIGDQLPKGLIYYELETAHGKATKKMLHLN